MHIIVAVLALIAFAVSLEKTPLPASWAGVWATAQGVPVVITLTGRVQTAIGARFAYGYDIFQRADGAWAGSLYATRRATAERWSDPKPKAAQFPRSTPREFVYGPVSNPDAGLLPLPVKTSTAEDAGDIQISAGATDSRGNPQSLRVVVRDGSGSKKIDGLVFPSMNYDGLTVAGTFSDGTLTASLTDERGRLGGTITVNQMRLSVRGFRLAARGGFELTDLSNGTPAGRGFVMWTPSPGLVTGAQGNPYATDQITVYIESSSLTGGPDWLLARKG